MIFKYSQSVLIALITDYGVLHGDKGYNHLSKHIERHHMKIWLSSFHLHRNWIFNWPGKKGHVRAFSPQGKQRSNDYACVNVGWRIDSCCLTGIIRNHASQRIKLFWSYSSFNFLYFCFFSLMYRNASFFLHVMYNRSCFLCFPWNFWAGNRHAAGENTYHLHTYPTFHCCDAVIKGESPYTFLSYFKRKEQNYLSCFWGRVRSCARAFRLCWIKARLFLISFGDTSLTNESIPKLKLE